MPPGRPTKLNEQIRRGIVTALQAGAFIREAAGAQGVSESAYHAWIARGQAETDRIAAAQAARDAYKGKSAKRIAQLQKAIDPLPSERPFVEFGEACARARHEAEVQALAVIRAAMAPHTRTRDVRRTEPDGKGKVRTVEEHREERVQGDWRAAAWYLERARPSVYGAQARLEISGSETGEPVQIVAVSGLDPDVSAKAHEFLRAAERRRTAPVDTGD